MHRRQALRLLASAATLPLLSREAFSLFQAVHEQLPEQAVLKTLSPHQNTTVTSIAEIIIPQTNTPGAKAARVNEFIDLILTEWYDEEEKSTFMTGLADVDSRTRDLYGKDFVECGEKQQIEILQGVLRAVRLLEDGTRQILAFYWAGDVVRPALATCQHYTAEAVTPCRVLRSKAFEVCASGKPCGANQVLTDTLSLVMAMSKKNSIARLAWFLLRIRPHLPSDPSRRHALRVLIPRADIADYLGTSMETVCRTLADFRSRGLIDLPNRKTIRFIDLAGLARVAGE